MEKKMENEMDNWDYRVVGVELYWGDIGIMEKKMETTV